jgi:hypothetical protein
LRSFLGTKWLKSLRGSAVFLASLLTRLMGLLDGPFPFDRLNYPAVWADLETEGKINVDFYFIFIDACLQKGFADNA